MLSAVIATETSDDQYFLVGDGGWQSLTSSSLSWHAYSSNGSVAVPATVPGQIHLDLERAGVIGNTYANFNQQANAWVREDSWTFKTNFTLSPDIEAVLAGGGEVWLVFDGVDTVASIFLDTDVPTPPPVPSEPMTCFSKHAHTLPNPRTPFAAQLSDKQANCAAVCIADVECGGFTMANPSGPDSSTCWIYHRPSDTPTSNGTGFRDGDWYSRIISKPECAAPPSPKGTMHVADQFLRYAFPVGDKLRASGSRPSHSLAVKTQSVASKHWSSVRKEVGTPGYVYLMLFCVF